MIETTQVGLASVGGRRLARAVRWRARRARAELAVRLAPDSFVPQLAAARIPVDAEVAVYFADGPERVYQLDQWLPVLERLSATHRVLLVLRDLRVLRHVQERSVLAAVCVRTGLDLANLYDASELKVCLYVNNGFRNFQSLTNPRMLHVHVNHGESDKLSSFSNQVKAYDRVLVAGPAALERYRRALIGFDSTKVLAVGRPDLDLAPGLPGSTRHTVLYAPTWEGESASNNWTSLDRLGVPIVRALLALPDVRVVYKPHPRVAGSRHGAVAAAHREVTTMIRAADDRDPGAGHVARTEGDILAMVDRCDALVGDVSSVTLDFLYLRPQAPIFLTDRRDDRDLLLADSPLAAAVPVVDTTTVGTLAEDVAAELAADTCREARGRVRAAYFGDLAPGDSTRVFTETVARLVVERDRLLAEHRGVTTGDVDVHG